MHYEQSAILTVHNHVITRNPRISVTHDKHDKHRTWFLHINNIQEEDRGRYMCQINTVTAKTQYGYVKVVGELLFSPCIVQVAVSHGSKLSAENGIQFADNFSNKTIIRSLYFFILFTIQIIILIKIRGIFLNLSAPFVYLGMKMCFWETKKR